MFGTDNDFLLKQHDRIKVVIDLKNFFKKIENENGSYSIETAIIMTVVFTVIMFLIFMSYVMYEQVRINAIAQDAAERGAVIYAMKNKEMITGRINSDVFNDQNPYWRVFDVGSNVATNGRNGNERINKIWNYVNLKLNAYKLDNNAYPGDAVEVSVKNYFLYKRVCVKIKVNYKVPFGGILGAFIQNPYPIEAYAEATVSEPSEFIRTVDIGSDLINGFGGETVEKYKGVIQRAIDFFR